MKKLILSLCFIALACEMFAGYNINTRSRCRNLSKKYVASARLFTGVYPYQRTASCGDAYAEVIKKCAWQKTFNGPTGAWQNGRVNNNFCSRGEKISVMDSFLLPNNNNFNDDYVEQSDFKSSQAFFNEITHSVEVKNISGSVRLQKGNGYYSSMSFSLWKPNDDLINEVEDENVDISKILNHFEIKVTDNGVLFNGNLVTDALKLKFIITETEKEIFVKFEDVNLIIPVSPAIVLDDLAFNFSGDGAPDTQNNLDNLTKSTNTAVDSDQFKFSLFPNPVIDMLNIDFSNNLDSGQTTIGLYNLNGEIVKEIFRGAIIKDEIKSIKINLSELIPDKYFILVQSKDRKLIKQFIKK